MPRVVGESTKSKPIIYAVAVAALAIAGYLIWHNTQDVPNENAAPPATMSRPPMPPGAPGMRSSGTVPAPGAVPTGASPSGGGVPAPRTNPVAPPAGGSAVPPPRTN